MKKQTKIVSPNLITTAFVMKSRSTQPKGKRAGQALKASAMTALAFGISGVGAAYGAVSGFAKGLVS